MNRNYFKAVRPDGTDFHTGTVHWLPADGVIPADGWLVKHPHPAAQIGKGSAADASRYLSLSTVATNCTGMEWPCRLLEVEPAGRAFLDNRFSHKRRVKAARVLRELPATDTLGPQGVQVAALIDQVSHLTADQIIAHGAAWDADRDAAMDAALGAVYGAYRRDAWVAVQVAARVNSWDAAWDAALGWLAKDLISGEDFRTLTDPWTQVMGQIEVAV